MQKVLSRLLKQSFDHGKIGRFTQARGTPIISHLMYVDDIVIFANGGRRSLRNLMKVLQLYENWTGQVLNTEKSAIYFSKKISTYRKNSLLHLSGFLEGSFPFKYLGVPIVVGKLRAFDFGELLEKVKKKIVGWKMKLLSAGGRLILLRHVLSSMAIHLFAVLHVPKVVIKALNRILSSFFWGDSDGKGKKKWISWTHICRPPDEGGLGIRDFSDIQEALHWKLAWRLIKVDYKSFQDFQQGCKYSYSPGYPSFTYDPEEGPSDAVDLNPSGLGEA
ncbi:uncharacterized protein LOC122293578 [Carya illinoinensis]|uniref:uncharacterized protein LOC122293578 n=1 Tax=Carya illinoinensis TaxID=32201 RepID=UPI001C71FB8E|nr:uncharacterized protein LOC122293578 [Carya illinoinensis]